ncbi:MAG: ZIP family metal transporter [Bacteroidota bacterium]|nr:ZIP family metal transporter [Bacteroidota bacterium]
MLAFSGAYLFSITVIHILPELFSNTNNAMIAGIFVLAGFYFQIIMDYFSTGVEHGHIHLHNHKTNSSAYILFVTLCIHSLLEGTLLVHPHVNHGDTDLIKLLFGLTLHKIPESIALVSVIYFQLKNNAKTIALLFVYALCSPLGVLLSGLFSQGQFIDPKWFTFLFAIVAGNFLHISTTIFFESEQPGHTFKGNKIIVMCMAAIFAVLAELFL